MAVIEHVIRFYTVVCDDCGQHCYESRHTRKAAVEAALTPHFHPGLQEMVVWVERCYDTPVAGVQKTRMLCHTCAKAPVNAE